MKSETPRICVPVCVRHASELTAAIAGAAAVADLIEVRLDCLADHERDEALDFLRDYLSRDGPSLLLTFRPADQGGHTACDFASRRRFWAQLTHFAGRALIDLEMDLVLSFASDGLAGDASIDWTRVICSHHDFVGVPADLDQIYQRMAATPAQILKIAVQANDATDCLPIFGMLERAQREGRRMIAIAMGQAGVMTRILGASRGSFLTFAALDDQSGTAPGQPTARDLRALYRINKINQETEVIGLIGTPVGHSLSPHIHNAAFEAAGLNAVYLPLEVNDADNFMRRMAHPRSRELAWNLRGLSVTAPHKSMVMNSLNWSDPAAQAIGAVNTISIGEGKLHGYNTDAIGFIAPLRRKFGSLGAARCAVIGAGGGARAAAWALRQEGAQVVLFARDSERARAMAEATGVEYRPLSTGPFGAFDIVINATPLGTQGELGNDTPATADQLGGVRLAYDLVYNPTVTRFLQEARAALCETLGGLEMLLAQAVEQFKIWTGEEPDLEIMRAAALRALGQATG